MKRVRARTLVLVNWKGVFYEKYDLDPGVTALEGSNGAGKTTVMIGAYVVLMPDMGRLRFTNLGEGGAVGGDRGIYGRLGEPGRPSYAVLDLRRADGSRLLAGVHLERRGEPTVELTPFLVTDLSWDVALQDVLLQRGELDEVPDRRTLRDLVARAGGRVKFYSTTKDYFHDLFEEGITPLRLSREEERAKFSEMLRTSMVGGISRALTGSLRDFLLKEESGLADTLQRMRENLDACHRTRLEVTEAQRLEGEISSVYEAGQAMFGGVVHATRAAAREAWDRLEDARARLQEAVLARDLVQRDRDETAARLGEAEGLVLRERSEVERLAVLRSTTREARRIQVAIDGKEAERVALSLREAAARGALADAEEALAARERAHRQALSDYEEALAGLADFKKGFQELGRRAAAFEEVTAKLGSLPLDRLEPERRRLEASVATLDEETVGLDRQIATAEVRRREHALVLEALEALSPGAGDPYERGRSALAELRRLDELAASEAELARRLPVLRSQAVEQKRVREAAAPLVSAAAVSAEAAAAEASLEALEADRQRLRDDSAEASRAGKSLAAQAADLERRAARWAEVSSDAAQLSRAWDLPLASRRALEALGVHLQDERDEALAARKAADAACVDLEAELRKTQQSGGRLPEALLRARDAVEGELLAGRFEDLSLDEAAWVQARLGPLAEAVVVEDPRAAAGVLAALPDAPDTVWLVEAGASLDLDGERLSDSALVAEDRAWRLTRVPEVAALGRRARERRLQDLHSALEDARLEAEDARARLRRLDEALRDLQKLLPSVEVLEEGDPAPRLAALREEMAAARERSGVLQAELAAAEARWHEVSRRRKSLVALLPQAHLLDREDLAVAITEAEASVAQAREAAVRLRAVTGPRQVLTGGLDVLRLEPPDEAAVAALRARLAEASEEARRVAARARDLRYVEENRHALAWADAPRALAEQQDLVPAMEAEVARSREAQERSRASAESSRGVRDDAQREHLREAGRLETVVETVAALRQDLAATGCRDASEEALRDVEARHRDAESRVGELESAANRLRSDLAVLEERLGARKSAAADQAERVTLAEAEWRPLQDARADLEARAAEHGVPLPSPGDLASDPAWQVAVKARAQLGERLEQGPLLNSVRALEDERRPGPYLAAWVAVRDWLRRRVPASIAETDDPLEALGRLREHLERLAGRLALQERDLRGQSSDVARNIETQVRRSRRQVEALNQDLRQVRFGSIGSVQLKVQHVERMWNVLEALKGSEAQALLFDAEVPVEEALEELFRRYGGGRTGGSRLLDYREYIELKVEVQRTTGTTWEEANPTRMSTGEAIGVGAAVMIVVLTAWEKDARLFRSSKSAGTLRFLFLDEANRLSQDSLSVLFELCSNLHLQLLIAAPEVARAEGNTTYRLVRTVDADGREEVLVTGRRARALSPA